MKLLIISAGIIMYTRALVNDSQIPRIGEQVKWRDEINVRRFVAYVAAVVHDYETDCIEIYVNRPSINVGE